MAVATEITAILQSAQSPDVTLRTQAEQQLKQFQEQNYAGFLYSLATELSNNEKPTDSRRLAGLILKNALDAKDEKRKAELAQQWISLDPGLRQQIKQSLLTTLGAQDSDARHTAALVVAKVAAIELPQNAWPELIQTLLNNMASQPASSGLRQSTLEALGYVCEEMGNLKEDFLEQEQVNNILTAVVHGMRKDETDQEVRLAATTALYNALEFAHTNFENDQERNYLMQVVCEGTVSSDIRVRQASFECLVKIAGNYYEKLPPYMAHIFTLTRKAVQSDEESVGLQAIEFWSTVCDEEIDIDKDQDETAGLVHHHFIQNALPHLVPMLLEQLTKQEEGQDQDDGSWNMSMAAGTCLELVANTVADAVVALVMPYVQENINKNVTVDDWRWREAATFAFGSILEGPSVDELARLVNMGLDFLLNAMKDPNTQVRNTTAWTIGRIFEFVHGNEPNPPIVTAQNLPTIVQVLLDSIKDEPAISEKVCYALSQLFVGFKDQPGVSPMSPYFQNVVQALLETAARPCEVHDQAKLQVAAFVAIQEVVRTASPDTLQLVAQLIPVLLTKLNETLVIPIASNEDRERQTELQGLLCGGVQVTIQRLSEDDTAKAYVLQMSDQIMEVLLHVFACRHASVHEEAMLVVGALTDAVGHGFIKYLERFFPVLEMGLANSQDWHACLITVGALGDISRSIGKELAPYCDRIMNLLILNLRSNEVHRNVKPPILSCFGDIALAIEDTFVNYLSPVLDMLHSAQQLSVAQQQSGDEEYFDYNNLLRHGILEAYAGIFNGLPQQLINQHMTMYAPHIIDYIEFVYNDKENVDESVIKAAVAIIGDVAMRVAGSGQIFVQKAFVQQFVHECKTSGDVGLVETANWASTMLSKATAA